MNKKLLIVFGIILILLVVVVWMYLFYSGKTSTNDGIFAQFGEGGDAIDIIENTPATPEDTVVNTSPQRLRQLTFLRSVAGATFTETGVIYVEQGTGHVFHINLVSGNETLVSGTTIPGTREAVFSPRGTYVAITHYVDGEAKTVLGSISAEGGLEGISLPNGAREFSFDENGERLYYLLAYENGSRGYSYDITGVKATELFDIPLRDIRVIWGEEQYVYTTPSVGTEGYVYKLINNTLTYIAEGALGLTALKLGDKVGITFVDKGVVTTKLVDNESFQFDSLIPEKCVADPLDTSVIFCAIPSNLVRETFPDGWYKGVISYEDVLWKMNVETGEAFSLLNFSHEGGRGMDVSKIGINYLGTKLFFINKNDNSLWLFDQTL